MTTRYACLVVEDSPMMRRLMGHALARVPGIDVTEAEDGLDAMRKLATMRFDLIITDLNMPIMDGLKLIKRVRDDAVHKNTPIIVVTTERGAEDRSRAMALGANAYVTKPIRAPEIVENVKRALALD